LIFKSWHLKASGVFCKVIKKSIMKPGFQVTKSAGHLVDFDPDKLQRSLCKSGATPEVADSIVTEISNNLFEGIRTKDIYGWAFRLLRQRARPAAARYSLKQALLQMGPSGYPFETFIGRLFEHDGWQVQVDAILEGFCIRHEVDVMAEKGSEISLCECKFHNRQGQVCDVKIPLYIDARFRDIQRNWEAIQLHSDKKIQGWIFTNTRFTDDAAQYGACAGMKVISWNEPNGNGLKDWIDRTGLHPLSCLTNLTRAEKQSLLEMKIVLVKDLVENPQALDQCRIRGQRYNAVMEEARALVHIN
jgi:hypothetical protein